MRGVLLSSQGDSYYFPVPLGLKGQRGVPGRNGGKVRRPHCLLLFSLPYDITASVVILYIHLDML